MARTAQRPLFAGAPIEIGQAESWAQAQGFDLIIGLDEAGRGPLAGPVVAAACALPSPCPIVGLNDSKKLTERRREALFGEIEAHALALGVVYVEGGVIDEINILRASLAGMASAWELAVGADARLREALVLTDGNQRAPLPEGIDQRPLVKGDARSLNIAAASILAKVARDRLMRHYDTRWPRYGFARHKGYPTAQHRAALTTLGPCPIHRRSFKLGGWTDDAP